MAGRKIERPSDQKELDRIHIEWLVLNPSGSTRLDKLNRRLLL
jgi:hypothetical protein